MVHRYRQGKVPAPGQFTSVDQQFHAVVADLPARLNAAMDHDEPQMALAAIWDVVSAANRYVDESAPWMLAKAERGGDQTATERLDTVLGSLVETLRIIAEALRPFLPDSSERIAQQVGVPLGANWQDAMKWGRGVIGLSVLPPQPIFPRLESDRLVT
jgi:methionyl-tRNA synthetase